ncbi:hypothetical protein BY996DRAFT_6606982 [Phakopsora pachyrhizi]|nr:hypothetical protein BY996DRAFT_6606982 [Phakopsora pachyrhizi]
MNYLLSYGRSNSSQVSTVSDCLSYRSIYQLITEEPCLKHSLPEPPTFFGNHLHLSLIWVNDQSDEICRWDKPNDLFLHDYSTKPTIWKDNIFVPVQTSLCWARPLDSGQRMRMLRGKNSKEDRDSELEKLKIAHLDQHFARDLLEWAGEPEIMALSRHCKKTIQVIQAQNSNKDQEE